jgi:Cys-tRNA(Pro) deacylase
MSVSPRDNGRAVPAVAHTLPRMEWPEPVERVAQALRAAAVDARLEECAQPTHTAAEAAEAVGCEPMQIVKTLVFLCDGRPVLALVPGDRRADGDKVARAAEAGRARVANADEVRAATGFDPGGVAPVAHGQRLRVLVERRLLAHDVVWIGAGSPRHVAGLAPQDLVRVSHGELVDLVP